MPEEIEEETDEEAPAPTAGETPKPRSRGRYPFRRRVCPVCADGLKVIDYKDVNFLRRFISDRARMETRRKTACCAKHQRALSRALKRARFLALLPYTPKHIRQSGVLSR